MAINRSTFTAEHNYKIDVFSELYDLNPSQVGQAVRYQNLKIKPNKTSDEILELANLKQSLQNYIISPEVWNKFSDSLTSMQEFIKDGVEGYILEKQTEFQAEIDKFTYAGDYSPTKTYFKKNTVKFNHETYLCLSDNTIGFAPIDATKWALIAKRGEQGIQGIQGFSGVSFVFKGRYYSGIAYSAGDAVEYSGSIYYADKDSLGISPTDPNYWTLGVSRGASTLLKNFSNKVILTEPTHQIPIGIPEYNVHQDALFVYVNSTYFHKDSDWRVSPDLTSIETLKGDLTAPSEIDFVVFKNVIQDGILFADGAMLQDNSVSDAKLMPDNKIGSLSQLNNPASSVVEAINNIKGYTIRGSADFNSTIGTIIPHPVGSLDYTVLITPSQNQNGYMGEYWVEKAMNNFIVKCSGTAIFKFDYIVFE
jgi:hypothetical protein